MNDDAIQTDNLTCYYGTRCIVDQLNLTVPRGKVFGFLGRNGAGKTTTIRMLMGLVPPTRGSARVLDYDCTRLTPEARARIGYLAEGHHTYGWMTVRDCGKFQSAQYGSQWNWEIFHSVTRHFRLQEKQASGGLSRGQRAGLCLAMTLAPEPALLILDDPALGLDPIARRSLLEAMIYVTRRADRTILFSSHILADVERVADEIAVMDRSVLRARCTVETFRQSITHYVLRFRGRPPSVEKLPGLLSSFRTERELALSVVHADAATEEHLAALQPETLQRVPQSLEEAFVDYVGDRGEKSFFFQEMETKK